MPHLLHEDRRYYATKSPVNFLVRKTIISIQTCYLLSVSLWIYFLSRFQQFMQGNSFWIPRNSEHFSSSRFCLNYNVGPAIFFVWVESITESVRRSSRKTWTCCKGYTPADDVAWNNNLRSIEKRWVNCREIMSKSICFSSLSYKIYIYES